MIALGLDTSTHATAVALRLDDGETLHARDDPAPGDHPGHATRLLEMAAQLLSGAGLRWAQLQRIVVGVGPGRFTGLRVGVATSRALAQALSIELAGVSSLHALAHGAIADAGDQLRVLAAIDALRGEVFAAGYAKRPEGVRCELELGGAISPQALAESLCETAEGGQGWLAVGDGALRYRAQLREAGAAVPDEGSPLHLVDARVICELGIGHEPVLGHEQLLPDYRRRPDAEERLRHEQAASGAREAV